MTRSLSIFTSLLIAIPAFSAESKLRFNRDIRPLMSDTCFHCHGPDKNSRKAGLRLDVREAALKPAKSGEIPIVPGKPEESEIIKRLFASDKDDLMPPDEAHKTFTPEQKEIFKRWVAEGAEYEPHWAYTPLVKPPTPAIKSAKFSIKNPIDAFIAEKLVEKNIEPSKEAEARTLIRRLSLDIIGLPPTTEEVEAFVQATTKNPQTAYEAAVDRLLKSPHYGERMAVWWLDVARFTDTVGFHGDQNARNFPYRDYVVDAFNQNKSFAQFTIEQLAGDLLPKPTTEQLVATGFNRLNMVTREGGAQPKEYLAKYGAERVRTVGGAWMGATLGCCECHDHKFDPYTAKDFYSMQSYFADVRQWGVYADYGYTQNPELKGYNNEYPFPPEIEVESPYLKQRIQRIQSQMRTIAASNKDTLLKDEKAKAAFSKWQADSKAFLKANPTGWLSLKPTVTSVKATPAKAKAAPKDAKRAIKPASKPAAKVEVKDAPKVEEEAPFSVESGNRVLFKNKPADNTSISMQTQGWLSAIRLELLPDESHKGSILRNGAEAASTLKLTASFIKASMKKAQPLVFRDADSDLKTPRYRSGEDILGIKDAWTTSAKAWNKTHTAICLLDKPLKLEAGDTLTLLITDNLAGCVRVSVSPFVPETLSAKTTFATVQAALKKPMDAALSEVYLTSTAWNDADFKSYVAQTEKLRECRNGKTHTLVTEANPQPLTVRVLPRGNWTDETGTVVTPASPEFLPTAFKPQEGKRLTRLDLAKWLCSKENPLTPRAEMNRLWKQFFGNGISIIVDDLGAQGEPPSHPELLDWIAAEFRDSGWDVKHMIKLFVMSSTYRQSSSLRPELRDIDPNNRLLSSQNPRRLDAEFVRDNALSIAGLLNKDMGGPSVKPYQPAGYYAAIQFPNRDYVADADDRQWRRGVYMHWQRTFLHPMLANFDAPARDECTANRPNSNTPQQALTLLNDPSFVEAARVFAQSLLSSPATTDEARIKLAFERAVAREPKAKELESLTAFLKDQRAGFQSKDNDSEKFTHIGLSAQPNDKATPELAEWTNVCRVVLNLHETITRY